MVGRAGLADFGGGNASGQAQFFQTGFAMAHAVEADLFVLIAGQVEHLHTQQLERAQQFPAAFEQ